MITPKEIWEAAVKYTSAQRTRADDSERHRAWISGLHDRIGREILQVLAEHGYKIVPIEPTDAMKAAMYRLNHPRDEEIYAAAIAAAPLFPPEEPAE